MSGPQVPKSEATASLERAFDAVRSVSASTPTFQQMDDERFARLMDRWLANGGAAKLAEALVRRTQRGASA